MNRRWFRFSAGARIHADRKLVSQALLNLLPNAVKFTPVGGQVRIAAKRDGGDPLVSVSDTGLHRDAWRDADPRQRKGPRHHRQHPPARLALPPVERGTQRPRALRCRASQRATK